MKIVQITSAKPVRYSTDGRNVQEFAPGQLYEVPDHVADGMVRRNWAKLMSAKDLEAMGTQQYPSGTQNHAPGTRVYKPELDPNTPQYDPKQDPNSPQYDPNKKPKGDDDEGDGDDDSDSDSTKAQGTTSPAPKTAPKSTAKPKTEESKK